MLFLFASDDVGRQHLHRILYLTNIVSHRGKMWATDLVLWLVSLEFRRMPNDILLQYFL
jgi:hypothetical protein